MSLQNTLIAVPGVSAARTATPRRIFLSGTPEYLAQSLTIAGACTRDTGNTSNLDVIRAGMLMGRITSVVNSLGTVGHYANSILGVTTNAEIVGSTAIEATAAVVTELVRRCGATGTFTLTGPPAASGVVVSETVTYSAASGTSITVTALVNAFVAGSFIQPTDGSQLPATFIPDGTGQKVTDVDGTSLDTPFREFPIRGTVDASQLLFWPSDTSLQAWLEARLPYFIFDHGF